MRLPLNAFAAFTGLGSGKGAVALSRAWLAGPLLIEPFLGGSPLGFHDRFRNPLPRGDGGRIASDVADQALALRGLDDSLMQLLGQLAGGKFGEGAGELGFMRHGARTAPPAELAERLVHAQTIHQVARSRQIE